MKVLLDAFALIAYFRDEPAASQVQRLLWEAQPAIAATQITEVIDRLIRVYATDSEEAEVAFSGLGLELIALAPEVAIAAGLLRAKHYGPTGRTLSLADAICAATALNLHASVATADPVLITVVTAEGGSVIELPGSGQ
jgi:PIN domain nuclease of toxin-antitoxin system